MISGEILKLSLILIPIMFLGTGQRPEDLVPFSPDAVLERILPTDF